MNGQTSPAVAARESWWSRNWKWLVPTGCGGCLLVVVLLALFGASIVAIVFGALKSSDVAQTAIARAKANPEVISALGTPIDTGMFVSGNINVSGGSGQADLSIPISGPKGAGTIYAVAVKTGGAWEFSTLTVQIKSTGEKIDLRAGTSNSF
jgi:hypothetical protein